MILKLLDIVMSVLILFLYVNKLSFGLNTIYYQNYNVISCISAKRSGWSRKQIFPFLKDNIIMSWLVILENGRVFPG